MKNKFVVTLMLVFNSVAFSQQLITLKGVVLNASSKGIEDATLCILNKNVNTTTNNKGEFVIAKMDSSFNKVQISAWGYATLVLSFVGVVNTDEVKITLQKSNIILDEVIVTAQKREELLQDIPLSITSLSARQVDEYRLWNSKDITALIPNLYGADPGDKRNVFSLRGIATTSYDPALATYIDGVNQFSLDTYIAQLFDVERIEILRGPQGTLYGRNAMAGVINIITKQPQNKSTGFVELSNGNKGLQRYAAGIRFPVLKDKLYMGIAGLYDQSNGFYYNDFNNKPFDKQHSFTGNYYVKYMPSNRLVFTLNAKQNNNSNNGAFPLVFGADDAIKNPFKLSQNAIGKLVDNIFNTSLSAVYNGRNFNVSSQTAYQSNYRYYAQPIDADFSQMDVVTIINNYGKKWNNVKVLTQEFKLTSAIAENKKLSWVAGTYFFHQNNPVKQTTHFGEDAALFGAQKNTSLTNTTTAKSNGLAIYAQANYALNKRINITAGIRYDDEIKRQSVLGEYQKVANPVFAYRSDTSASTYFQALSPKFSLGFKLTESNLLYVNYSKGFRSGGLTPLSSDPSQPALFAYKPEYSSNLEIGIKNTFLQNKLLLNVTAFYTYVNDVQVPTFVLPDAVTITKNAGKLSTKGVELEMHCLLKGFQIDYNLGYNDATFNRLFISQNGLAVDLKGKRQIFTPDLTSMLAMQYNITVLQKQQLKTTIRTEYRYLGKQYFDLANSISQPSYNLLNAAIDISIPKLSIKFWCRNLTDIKYISYGYDFGAVRLGDSKTFGVTASLKLKAILSFNCIHIQSIPVKYSL